MKKIFNITKNMKRVTFTHKDLENFPVDEVGGYIKFIFEKNGKNLVRPFTVRNFKRENLELDVDFAIHSNVKSLASNWAIKAKVNDMIKFTGPGPKNMVDMNSTWFLLVGDLASLPAISVNLEQMSKRSKGQVFIELSHDCDIQKLIKPENVKINWILNSENSHSKILEKIDAIEWYDQSPFIWVATEFSLMKKIRSLLLSKNDINKKNMYISSYWKRGLDQEQHKLIKKQDSKGWI